ncbi:hypothetical protein NERG_00520 [Nematocida ausubeli]|uniref:Uncharacterized protein n=1 Tax=Nematocida ausubeli (strain ATCC PRA-371 / ERTm2) TaxID=1913371 RepID=H8ZA99_NEMA1|nr:hypothetical protein NERG_00520 [Nematocida ausubeli]
MKDTNEDVFHGIVPLPGVYLEKMLTDPPRRNPNALLDGLVISPKIIATLIQSIPMPWETEKTVTCAYNTDGIILGCTSKNSEDSLNYKCKWLYILDGIVSGLIYSVKRSNYTIHEYKRLREKYPHMKISRKINKERLFPLLYNGARDFSKDIVSPFAGSHEIISEECDERRVMSRESNSVLLERTKNREKTKRKISHGKKQNNPGISSKTPYKSPKKEFESTMEWSKFARLYVHHGRNILNYVITERKIKYLNISDNYALERKRVLTTKEKKKSRMGQTFHIVQELFKLLSRIVWIIEKKNSKEITLHQSLQYLFQEFTQIGINTAIYRYKYSTIKQISEMSKIARILSLQKEKTKIPYDLMWCETWRIWTLFLLGSAPLFSSRLADYVVRRREGRRKRQKKITKQRVKSAEDIQFKEDILDAISGIVDLQQINRQVLKNIMKSAWKQWKREDSYEEYIRKEADKRYFPLKEHQSIKGLHEILISKIEEKGNFWCKETVEQWNKYVQCKISNKKEIRKIKSRMLRAAMLLNKRTQRICLEKEFSGEKKQPIDLQRSSFDQNKDLLALETYKKDTLYDILEVSLNKLASTYKRHLKQEEKKEVEFLRNSLVDLPKTLTWVTKRISKKKETTKILLEYGQDITKKYSIEERVVDAYLEHLISYHMHISGIAQKTLPLDDEPLPVTLMKYAKEIQRITKERHDQEIVPGACPSEVYFSSVNLVNLVNEIDRDSLMILLNEICDKTISEYIVAQSACTLVYKDISSMQRIGLSKGLEFHSVVSEIILQRIDVLLLEEAGSTVLKYFRCSSTMYILHTKDLFSIELLKMKWLKGLSVPCIINDLDPQESILKEFSAVQGDTNQFPTVFSYLKKSQETAGSYIQNIFGPALSSTLIDAFPVVLSAGDFDIRLSHESASIQASQQALNQFQLCARKIYYDTAGSSFAIAVDRWNRLVTQNILFFRETLTTDFFQVIEAFEEKIKRRIMSTVNTQMKKRFPNVMFYSGKDVGGLGFISHLVLIKSISTWSDEIELSQSLYSRILGVLNDGKPENTMDSVNTLFNDLKNEGIQIKHAGIPRVHAFMHKSKMHRCETGWRLRNYNSSGIKRWTNEVHDGYWVIWARYNALLHSTNGFSLKSSTVKFVSSPEKSQKYHANLYRTVRQAWNTQETNLTVEDENKDPITVQQIICHTQTSTSTARRTKAQIGETARLPNKMLMLWWSPIINRSKINVGHNTPIPETLIPMHGKFSSLRLSYEKLFSSNLWQEIHKQIVLQIISILEGAILKHNITEISVINSETSLSENILPCISFEIRDKVLNSAWVALRLRWSDIDSVPVQSECKEYVQYMSESASKYSHTPFGCIVLVDLLTCEYSVEATDASVTEVSDLIRKSLCQSLLNLSALQVLKNRASRLVGYSNTAAETSLFNPRSLFRYSEKTVFLQLSETELICLNVHTGQVYRSKFKRETKLVQILKYLNEIISCNRIQYAFSLPKTHSLLSKSGIICVFMPCNLVIEMTKIPDSLENVYAAYTGTLSSYTYFCRTALILRHSLLCAEKSVNLLHEKRSDEEWIEVENRLTMDICRKLGQESGVTGELLVDSETIQKSFENIVFGVDVRHPFIVKPAERKDWTNMTDWRYRYQLADSEPLGKGDFSMGTSSSEREISVNSLEDAFLFEIDKNVIRTFLQISDPLIPVIGLICSDSAHPEISIFITPRQLFISRNFYISSLPMDSYRIEAIIQTKTVFSAEIEFTYSGLSFTAGEHIMVVSADISTGICTGNICVVDSIGETFSLHPQKSVKITKTQKRTRFLTAIGWNRNINEHKTNPVLVPEKPLPFYSEEFRKSHFQN